MISLIVAAGENGVIGNAGELPWRQSADMKYFRATTLGHPIIMGRKTFESMGRPLPDRPNIVVTRNPDYHAEGVKVATSLEAAIEVAKQASDQTDELFVIGGGQLFKEALPLADKIYITRIHASPAGDAFFEYDPAEWKEASREDHDSDDKNQYPYSFLVLTRK